MRVWPGSPHPLGATWNGEGVNFALFSENATAVAALPLRRSDRRRADGHYHHGRADRQRLARLPARRPAGRAVRLPGGRAVRAHQRASVQPEQAAHRPLRQGGERSHPLERRALRLPDRGRAGGPLLRLAGLGGRHAQVPRGRPGLHLGGRPAPQHAVEPDGDLRDTRAGHDGAAPGRPRAPARHLPRPGLGPDHRPSARARRDRGGAHAGAPLRGRPASGRPGADELLGLQLHRLLGAARGLRHRRTRAAGERVQVDGAHLAPGRARGDPRRRLQPHRRGQPARADAVPARHRQLGLLPAHARSTPVPPRLHRHREQPEHPPPAAPWHWSSTACATG